MSPPLSNSQKDVEENLEQTTKSLFLEIQSALQKGRILEADELRERLLEVNPMALTEIIKSAEIIEKAKSASIDKDHLETWDTLYSTLSEEERNCLFYSLKKVVVPPKKIILSKGSFNNRLFFIDRGHISILYPKGDKHIVLAQLGQGNILGEYTFATISLCSATAASTSEVHLMCLESAATDDWEQKHPGLYEKLIDFCMHKGQVDEIIKRKKLEKPTNVRHAVEGRVTACLLTQEGKKTDTQFRGNMSDLSVTGTSFMIKCSKKAIARALLARHLLLSFSIEKGGKKYTFSSVGRVVGVSFHLYNDYTAHIHFMKPIQEEEIRKACFQGD
jgi:CRP-like cAMP-binding protein